MVILGARRRFGQLVVRQHIGFGLLRRQMLEADHWRFGEPHELGRLEPAMSRDHAIVLVDEDRRVEAERLDAVGDCGDLLPLVPPRIVRVRNDRPEGRIGDDRPLRDRR